ncbi:MAG: hypothetical protein WCJ92_04095, partial [Alphaproteobacteria bacterium]
FLMYVPPFSGAVLHCHLHVCIGDNQFLSNAHCFKPWCDSNGQPKYSLYINAEEKGRKKISNLQIHKLYLKGKVSSKKAYDIAYFSIEDSVQNIEGVELTYLERISPDLFGKHLDVIGYGISGDVGSWFGSCDGLKRAIVSPIDSYFSYVPGQIVGIASYFGMKVEYDGAASRKDTVIALKAHQAGFRPGMSGGGVFYDDKYVAISSRHNFIPSWRSQIRRALYTFLKGIAALGIPTPFLQPTIGDQECFLILGPLKAWIENKRESRKSMS